MADEKQTAPMEPQAVPSSPQETTTALRDKRITPEGVVPKQAQGYVIAGLAVLILMAVMFSKNHVRPAAKTADTGPLAMSTDVNQRKIQELEQDLSADQRQSQRQAMAQKNMGDATPSGAPSPTESAVAIRRRLEISRLSWTLPVNGDPVGAGDLFRQAWEKPEITERMAALQLEYGEQG